MVHLSSIPDTPDQYTHSKWQWKDGKPWASDEDLPDIVLQGETLRERITAIRRINDKHIRAELACCIKGYDEVEYLLQGVSDEMLLRDIVMDPRSKGYARSVAINRIENVEILAELAAHGPRELRSHSLERRLEKTKDPELLLQMANDLSLPMPRRMEAALMLGNSSDMLKLIGTDIYKTNDRIRKTVDQMKQRIQRKEED